MKFALAGVALGFAVIAVPVSAQTPAPAKDPNQQICKREKKPNSRFTTKTCFTRAQWAEMAEVNKRAYAESRDRPTIEIRRDTGVIGSPR